MKVTVISMQAIMHGREPIVWTGNVPRPTAVLIEDAGKVNEYLFRHFNRVDEADVKRLMDVGYSLPSLSVGDVIYWNRRAWRVAGQGFREIDRDDLAMASLFDTIRPDNLKITKGGDDGP